MTTTPAEQTIALRVNGAPHRATAGVTVEGLLRHLGRDPGQPGFAVAVNETIVRRAAWASTLLADGDRVEIVTASQGG
jgi:sulfur carrier protein